MSLKDLVVSYKNAVAARKDLDVQAKMAKEEEEKLRDEVIAEMQRNDMQSVKYPGIGHVVIASKSHYEVRDRALLCREILSAMIAAYNAGRPIEDALIVQARPSKEALEVYLEESNKVAEDVGLVLVSKPELSVRKA